MQRQAGICFRSTGRLAWHVQIGGLCWRRVRFRGFTASIAACGGLISADKIRSPVLITKVATGTSAIAGPGSVQWDCPANADDIQPLGSYLPAHELPWPRLIPQGESPACTISSTKRKSLPKATMSAADVQTNKVRLPKCLAGNTVAVPAPVAPQAELLAMLSQLDAPTMEIIMQTMRRFTAGSTT